MSAHDFKPKPFLKAATDYLQGRLDRFRKDIEGTPLEAATITYGKREGWFLPTDSDLSALTILNLFPNAWPLDWSGKVESRQCTEREAKLGLDAAMKADMREVNAGVERVRQGVMEPHSKTIPHTEWPAGYGSHRQLIPANLTAGPQGGGQEQGSPPAEPLISPSGPVKGIPEGLASSVVRVHRLQIAGRDFYTLDRDMAEKLQAAQVQKVTVRVESIPGDHGERIAKITVTDP